MFDSIKVEEKLCYLLWKLIFFSTGFSKKVNSNYLQQKKKKEIVRNRLYDKDS